jgi:hypothetical protein
MEFECSICGYKSDNKYNVTRHIDKKCINAYINEINIDITCDKCGKKYKTKGNLKKHLKKCKFYEDEKDKKIKELENKVEELNSKLSSSGNTIITNNIQNIQQQNNMIIQITPYNDPDMEGLEKYYLMALKKVFLSVPTLIEKVHFNREYPQNFNICISNYRTKLAKVFNGEEWRTVDEDKLIEELLNTYESLLEGWAEDDEDRMKYIEKYNDIKDKGNESVKKIKEEIKNMIYDKRGMVKIKST